MPGYTIVKFMATWNPISVMVVTAFLFTLAVIGYYVVTGMAPPQWLLSLGTIVLGVSGFAGGGAVTALHATSVAEQTRSTIVEANQQKNGNGTTVP